MDGIILPNNLEMCYRKKRLKNIRDVLDRTICCAICNSDLKENIILNNDIMLHKTFLCLCCKICFDKLSDSHNGCIFCSMDTKLKTCKTCSHNMCERCINNFYTNATHLKKLKKCLSCSPSGLWKLRSEADAVLKCFSLELKTRLLLSGNEFEAKQNLLKFIKNTAKCNDNFTQEYIHQIRVHFLFNSLESKIIPLINKHEELKTIEEKKQNFFKLCEQILMNTSSLLLHLKSFLNVENVSLNNKVQSILRNGNLFKNPENTERRATNLLQNICNVSLNEENVHQELSNKLSSETIKPNVKSTDVKVYWNPEVRLQRFDMKECNNHVDIGLTSTKSKLTSEAINKPSPENTADKIVSLNKNVFWNPEIRLQQFDMKEYNNHVDGPNSKKIKLSTEAIKLITECTADQIMSFNKNIFYPEIRLHRFDTKEYNNHIHDVGPNSNRNKLSTEAFKPITENTTDQIMSFNNTIVYLNPEIRLHRFDMKEYYNHIDDVGPNSNRNKLRIIT